MSPGYRYPGHFTRTREGATLCAVHMMSGLMAKPLPKKETRSFASHVSLNDQPAWVQELVLPPPKKGEVLLLARISDETAERASRNDHRCEKCGLGLGLAGAPRRETSGLRAGNTPRAQIVRFRVRPAA